MVKPRYNQKINLTIKSLGLHGEGVGYWHGYTVFVDDALPGEVIEARITHKDRKFGRARVTKLIEPSPGRVEPSCPLFGKCGGCQIMHLGYEHQLNFKRQRVVDAFRKYETLSETSIQPCIPSPNPKEYRNKIQIPVGEDENGLKLGLYARASHDIIAVDHCEVHCQLGEAVFKKVKALIAHSSIKPYKSANHDGDLRYVLVKTAVNTQQALVVFVVNQFDRALFEQLAQKVMETIPEVKGVILNINTSPENVVLGEQSICLAGEESIQEQIGGLFFKVSPASFFQVNTHQASNLYQAAISAAQLQPSDRVLDAYCGVGTLALLMANHVKEVIGIECVDSAVADANLNARFNKIGNSRFICGQVEDVINSLDPIDVVVLNPPRKGCEKGVLDAIIRQRPRTILYISCDPVTLARDLNILVQAGFSLEIAKPFDMFPQTAHVECLVKLC